MLWFWILFMCQLLTNGQTVPDECSAYKELDDYRRSTAYSTSYEDRDEWLCDENLDRNSWYRFTSPAGGIIPNSCPQTSACGTQIPIWAEGALPDEYQTADLNAYMVEHTGCKAFSLVIQAMNCTDFIVYKLERPGGCYAAYCAGDRFKCRDGTTSDDGFSPCFAFTVNETVTPVLDLTSEKDEQSLDLYIFRCSVKKPSINLGIHYQFYANDKEVMELVATSNTEEFLPQEHNGEHTWKMGDDIQCCTCVYLEDGGDDELPGEWDCSNVMETGIKVHTEVLHVNLTDDEETYAVDVEFSLHIPLHCYNEDQCQMNVEFKPETDFTQVVRSDCKNIRSFLPQLFSGTCRVQVASSNWNQTHKITLMLQVDEYSSTPDGMDYNRYKTQPFTKQIISGVNPMWREYTGTLVIVHAYREGSLAPDDYCRVYNDPHVNMFGGRLFYAGTTGQHVLVKDELRDILVVGQFENCLVDGSNATCLCGIAARHHEIVFRLTHCDRVDDFAPLHLRVYTNHCPDVPPGFRVLHGLGPYGGTYTVHLPSGAKMTIEVKHYTEYYVQTAYYPSRQDIGRTSGLCGKFGEQGSDAVTNRAGDVVSTGPDFLEEWKSRSDLHEEIMFGVPGNTSCWTIDDNRLCECDSDGGDDFLNCTAVPPFEQCVPTNTDDILPQLIEDESNNRVSRLSDVIYTQGSAARMQYKQKRLKASVTKYDNVTAEQLCRQAIEDGPAAQVSEGLVMPTEIENTVQACIGDVMMTGSLQWVGAAAQSVSAVVKDKVSQNISTWDFGTDVQPPGDVLDKLCNNDCTQQGHCTEAGVCECFDGFEGYDCSILSTSSPEVLFIGLDGFCNRTERLCDQAQLYGGNFGDHPQCHYTQFAPVSHHNSIQQPGTIISITEVRCPIPESQSPAEAYTISVGKLGSERSQEFTFLTFDSTCMDCMMAEGVPLCELKADTCSIDGQCWTSGQSDDDDQCRFCDPSQHAQQWTKSDEEECQTSSIVWVVWVLIGILAAAFIGILIIGAVYQFQGRSGTKINPGSDNSPPFGNKIYVQNNTSDTNGKQSHSSA